MFGRRKSPRLPGRIDTLVGRGTTLKGELEFGGGLHVDGVHIGEVRGIEGSAPSTLWVGESGQIRGDVEVAIAVINGEVVGNVRAAQRVVLGAKARVTGDVTYGVIEMTLGARVDGRLVPLAAAGAVAEAKPTPALAAEAKQPAAALAAEVKQPAAALASAPTAEPARPDNVLRPFDLRQGRN